MGPLGPLVTHVFTFPTAGASSEDVWRVITCGTYLHGLELVSDWQPGSVVEACGGAGQVHRLRGHVVAADRPVRLSLTFEDGTFATHLTWEVGPAEVRLYVDELDGDSDEDAAKVWTPVVEAVRAAIRERSVGST